VPRRAADDNRGMSADRDQTLTELLHAGQCGDEAALRRVWERVYDELRGLAAAVMRRHEGDAPSFEATALVHEAYLRLLAGGDVRRADRAYFFGAAAMAMRRILIERARRRRPVRESDFGGLLDGVLRIDRPEVDGALLDDLDSALDALELAHPTAWNVVMHRYFAGLSVDDTAEMLELSPRTVDRLWAFGRAWLYDRIAPEVWGGADT